MLPNHHPLLAARALCGLLLAAPASAQLTRGFPQAPELLAVRTLAPGLEPELSSLSAAAGVQVVGTRPYGPRDVLLLELEGELEEGARRAAVQRLQAHPQLRFASLVRRCEYGLPMLPTERILLRFEASVPLEEQRGLLEAHAGLSIEEERFGGMEGAWSLLSAARTGAGVLDQVDMLVALPGLRWVESDRVLGAVDFDVIPGDPLFPNCWGLHNTGQTINGSAGQVDFDMDLPAAWELEQGDPGVLVVVMDNGTQLNHPDLNLVAGADFSGNGSGGGPHNGCSNHGTAVAGCVAALIDNALGTVGSAPGCRVAPVAVHVSNTGSPCPNNNAGQASWKVAALLWAELIGARITNQSYGSSFDSAWSDKMDETQANGMVHFAASGNSGLSLIGFPANDSSVIAVGSVQNDGQLADYSTASCPNCGSNTGSDQNLVAPGKDITTTDRTGNAGYVMGDYATVNGTSFASPYAAGVGALLLSRHPSLSAFEVELILQMSARDLGASGRDDSFGYGLVRADYALRLADELVPELAQGVAYASPAYLFVFPPFFQTVVAATGWVSSGGAVVLRGGTFDESMVIDKDVTLYRWDAPAVVGQ